MQASITSFLSARGEEGGVGRPNSQWHYEQAIYGTLDRNDFSAVEALTDAKRPVWWKKGMSLRETRAAEAVVAKEALEAAAPSSSAAASSHE
eukprot:6470681-Amphidinium_carterae.1